MTAIAGTISGMVTGARRGNARFRGTLWVLHTLVIITAVLSLFLNRFGVWVDLRLLGPMQIFVEILWVSATLLVPVCTGPRLAGFFGGKKGPRWELQGFAPAWGLRLLWPTYFLLACLIANTVYYYRLMMQGRVDNNSYEMYVPLTLIAAVILGTWALLTREWVRQTTRSSREAVSVSRWTHLRATIAGLIILFLVGPFLLILSYARPPAGPVDLAVVLGTRLKKDGSASVILAERVQIACNLYKRGIVKHIMLSGAMGPPEKPGGKEYNELAAMKQVALDAGIPEEAITVDPIGVNTRATAYNAREFMRKRGYSTVVACTTDFHLYRTVLAFREMGIDAYGVASNPADWRCADVRDTFRDIVGVAVYKLDPHYREPIAVSMHMNSPRVVVTKSKKSLELFDGSTLVKSYPCISGGNSGDKQIEGDRRTPVGHFRVVFKNPQSKFHLSLGLDYPNREDAERGLKSGLITQKQHDDIVAALGSDLSKEENQKRLWYTPLGGEIFLHGFGEGRTGTAGCVALKNDDIEELFAVLPVGTPVEIAE